MLNQMGGVLYNQPKINILPVPDSQNKDDDAFLFDGINNAIRTESEFSEMAILSFQRDADVGF